MSKSKKVIITLSVVCAVVIIALVTVVAVWAATSQTVTNQLTVRYTATNVSATVKAEYKLGTMQDADSIGDASSYTSIGSANFFANNTTTSETLPAKEIVLTDATSSYVYFRYTFTNTGSNTITVSIADPLPTASNMSVRYAVLQNDPDFMHPSYDFSDDVIRNITIRGGDSYFVFIQLMIESVAHDASYTGTISWNLANKTT